ncbi:NEAT_domain-containing leucine-rich repeat protein [Hexamita inflata]|uniref:NEAT domain-containing leucine-rich repeat protein n=1 Tax=Hexamita inflata TaxID=28002 RepID=A0AA86TLA1_9EUKA|nr:NEAT domain-containing leucine-rich repeat protein [Hexamita inflata]
MQSSKKLSQEQKNISAITNQSEAPDKLYNLSEYDKSMIQKYQNQIKDGTLTIHRDSDLKSLDFIRLLKLNELELTYCNNIIPKLESLTINKIKIMDCGIQSVKDFQLENLKVLNIDNYHDKLQSNTLVQEILQFYKLKELTLYNYITDFSPLSQMTKLTKLCLVSCNLRSTGVLRPLINLEELNLNSNDIDITALQYLTNLTNLSLRSCNLVSLDVLRPLKKLKELNMFYNKIVYLLPLMELKQLSKLDVRFNKIMDTEYIQLHPNVNNFKLDDQDPPTKEELKKANILRDINSPITSIKQLQLLSSRVKEIYTVFRQNINQQLQDSYNNHEQFVARVALLFQKMNLFDGYQ